jgi:histone H3/H4
METQEIKIRVSPQAANMYQSASEEERSKLDLLLSLKLREIGSSSRSINEIMREASKEAQAQGLAEEVLRKILNEQ